MKSENWMQVARMWTSTENVSIAEFECATFEVTDADIQAAPLKHHAVNQCNHDAQTIFNEWSLGSMFHTSSV